MLKMDVYAFMPIVSIHSLNTYHGKIII